MPKTLWLATVFLVHTVSIVRLASPGALHPDLLECSPHRTRHHHHNRPRRHQG